MAYPPEASLTPEAFTERLHQSGGPIAEWPFADVYDLAVPQGDFIRTINMYTPAGESNIVVGSVQSVEDNQVHLRQLPTQTDGLAHEELTVTLNSADDAKAWEQMHGVRLVMKAKPTTEINYINQRRGIVPLEMLGIEQPIEPSVNGHALYRSRSAGRKRGYVQGIVALMPEAHAGGRYELRVGMGSPALRGTILCVEPRLEYADGLQRFQMPQTGDHIRARVERTGIDASVFYTPDTTRIFVGKHSDVATASA